LQRKTCLTGRLTPPPACSVQCARSGSAALRRTIGLASRSRRPPTNRIVSVEPGSDAARDIDTCSVRRQHPPAVWAPCRFKERPRQESATRTTRWGTLQLGSEMSASARLGLSLTDLSVDENGGGIDGATQFVARRENVRAKDGQWQARHPHRELPRREIYEALPAVERVKVSRRITHGTALRPPALAPTCRLLTSHVDAASAVLFARLARLRCSLRAHIQGANPRAMTRTPRL